MPERAEIEAVARAIYDAMHEREDWAPERTFDELPTIQREAFLDDAQAAIAACDALRRSPQGEDHEAGIGAATNALLEGPWFVVSRISPQTVRSWLEPAIAAYLSCASPSRDGTVAVEDVVRWLKVRQGTWSVLVKDFEREFGSARAGESNEGGNQ